MDIRRTAFAKKLELMKIIGEIYGNKAEEDIKDILREHPFDDELYQRYFHGNQ